MGQGSGLSSLTAMVARSTLRDRLSELLLVVTGLFDQGVEAGVVGIHVGMGVGVSSGFSDDGVASIGSSFLMLVRGDAPKGPVVASLTADALLSGVLLVCGFSPPAAALVLSALDEDFCLFECSSLPVVAALPLEADKLSYIPLATI